MNRRGLSLIEMTIAIGITAVIGLAIASMMAAATNSLASKDDGRQSAIRLATTQVRLGAYIAPSNCLLDKANEMLTLWFDDTNESNSVHIDEVRWIQYDSASKELSVKFVNFPDEWTPQMVENANIECNPLTDYSQLLESFSLNNHIEKIALVDSITNCKFWTNNINALEATQVSIRLSLESIYGETKDAIIDEGIRLHQSPSE